MPVGSLKRSGQELILETTDVLRFTSSRRPQQGAQTGQDGS